MKNNFLCILRDIVLFESAAKKKLLQRREKETTAPPPLSNQRSGDGDPLFLSSGELRASFADERLEFGGKSFDEVEGVGGFRRRHDFRLRRRRVAEEDVGLDRSREQNRLLTHHADVGTQLG